MGRVNKTSVLHCCTARVGLILVFLLAGTVPGACKTAPSECPTKYIDSSTHLRLDAPSSVDGLWYWQIAPSFELIPSGSEAENEIWLRDADPSNEEQLEFITLLGLNRVVYGKSKADISARADVTKWVGQASVIMADFPAGSLEELLPDAKWAAADCTLIYEKDEESLSAVVLFYPGTAFAVEIKYVGYAQRFDSDAGTFVATWGWESESELDYINITAYRELHQSYAHWSRVHGTVMQFYNGSELPLGQDLSDSQSRSLAALLVEELGLSPPS